MKPCKTNTGFGLLQKKEQYVKKAGGKMVSSNRNKIILLTNRYPFFPGEQFLETEMKYIANLFEEIHIIPANGSGKRRDVPKQTRIHSISGESSKAKKHIGRLFTVMFDGQARRWFMKDAKRAIKMGPKALLILINWLGHAVRIRKYIEKQWLKNNGDAEECLFYSYWLTPSAVALAMIKENYKHIQVVSRAHRGDLYEADHVPPYLPLQRETIRHLDSVHPISADAKRYLLKNYNEVNEKFYISRLGTESPQFMARSSQDGTFRVVTCSFMKPVKRLHLLIEGLKYSKRKIHWTHIGDGDLRTEIEEKAKKELPPNVSVEFKGQLDNRQVYEFYKSHPVDVFINVSSSEGIPVTIMEAFSVGIPVIATNVGGVKEVVNEHTGILLDPNVSPERLNECIETFIGLPEEEKKKYRLNAYKMWRERYNAEQNYNTFFRNLKRWDFRSHG
ncbi:glycosyltransferase [Fictibacillus sp. Mic-4]|uniref:glycosyltransferase n=1 Tax=Fictibacillus sp. Mic-4 TaxID=3132826 RepID=UPI003CEA20AB